MQGTHWHFLPDDRRLQYGYRELVEVGKTIRVVGTPKLCKHGLHASVRAIDALWYAPGPIVCRVTLGGEIVEDDDKVAAEERTVVWMADATNTLHEFACRCAEDALRATNINDRQLWEAIEVKRRWLKGEATNEQLAAARAAAMDAARAAAWAAQNTRLESMLYELQPVGAA